MASVECVWPLQADLGEGPFWSAAEKSVWFVDIVERRIHRFEPDTGRHQSWTAPAKVSFVLPEARGSFLVGLPGAVARFHAGTGAFEILARVEGDYPQNRLNDAGIDRRGRLWFGSMDEDSRRKSAAIYRWGAEPAPVLVDAGYCISNGPAFSPDGRAFYATDTLDYVLYRFAVGEDGALGHKTPLIRFKPEDGFPDGTTVDAEGCLWVAFWGGWCVRRFSPDGRQVAEVKLPCAHVTKLAFGGDALRTAYVTTARHGLGPQDLAGQPLAGGLFAFAVDVPGLPQPMADGVGAEQ
ncbi:MAG: SMP-30/gluconolactonase/LRE family protein [Alphaproteobacteria bacterium]|nr:SMP-30/gluconolactonase/LRE family protein [Alphaproteobacteria bacterium]